MDLSLFFFASNSADARANYTLLLDAVKFADANGFAAVWTPERHFHTFGGAYPNPAVTSAALATVTSNISIRAGSVVAPLHDPLRIAEEWSVVDNLSNGRSGVAFASGWHTDDFVFQPERYEDRRKTTISTIESVRALWQGDSVTRIGGDGMPTSVSLAPRPVQPELPMWLTSAGSSETFQAAGNTGMGLLTHLLGQTTTALAERIAEYRSAFLAARTDDSAAHVAVMAHTFLDRDGDHARALAREPFANYLTESFDLVSRLQTVDASAAMSANDIGLLVDRAVDRYMTTSGIFGSPREAMRMIDSLRDIGVDEVACLIDFGLPHETVMRGLEYLASLGRLIQ
ncbi:MupA/Atu3671 family FMN-dependent luciferase-like monooxygenase [Nocardia salmonicida]|uniref:MupA/Atu3671 family FMN-dependent luciferase-like monooxygenase n=1 Tax=Nocardia salmonicida TaxID=53431 RepID=UPI0037B9DDD8